MIAPDYALRDGNRIPALGLGTYGLNGDEGTDAILSSIDDGYRLIDTAVNYGNEEAVGQAIARTDVDRSDLLITTKLPGRDHGYDETLRSFEQSRRRLGVEWVDLYLIHWPNPSVDRYVETWRAMISLREKGLARSIGVSNFTEQMLTRLGDETGLMPVVNQVELHPYFPQDELRAFHDEYDIRTESWSPLGRKSDLLQEPLLGELAAEKGVTVPQLVLRWHVELEAIPIPKSSQRERRAQNLDVFGFELAPEEVEAISSLRRGRIWGADPNTHEEQ